MGPIWCWLQLDSCLAFSFLGFLCFHNISIVSLDLLVFGGSCTSFVVRHVDVNDDNLYIMNI